MSTPKSGKLRISACSVATILLGSSLTLAKAYDIAVDPTNVNAKPAEIAAPALPDSTLSHASEILIPEHQC